MSLSIKDPQEKINVTFDFSTQYTTVNNPAVTVYLRGEGVDLTSMKGSSPMVIESNKVVIAIQGGEHESQYELRCKVDTNTGEQVVAKDILTVKTL